MDGGVRATTLRLLISLTGCLALAIAMLATPATVVWASARTLAIGAPGVVRGLLLLVLWGQKNHQC